MTISFHRINVKKIKYFVNIINCDDQKFVSIETKSLYFFIYLWCDNQCCTGKIQSNIIYLVKLKVKSYCRNNFKKIYIIG